ncbi:unnamed protein product [Calypogeia fissa]
MQGRTHSLRKRGQSRVVASVWEESDVIL